MSEARRFGLIGGTLYGNRGAEAMTVTAIGRVRDRFPGSRFVIFSYTPTQDRRLLGVHDDVTVEDGRPAAVVIQFVFGLLCAVLRVSGFRFPRKMMPASARSLASCDLLLDVCGISFDDGRPLHLPYHVLSVIPAVLMGVRVVKLSQAMGPFETFRNRWAARFTLRRCLHSFVRGQESARFLEEQKLPEGKWSRADDIAFLYQPGDSLTSENFDRIEGIRDRLKAHKDQGGTVVGIAPSSLVMQRVSKTGGDYVHLLVALIRELLSRKGIAVVVVPNATREGTDAPRNNDLYAIDRMEALTEQELDMDALRRVTFVDFDVNTRGIREVIGLTDVLITSRFHAMVAGLALQVPTVVIGWSHKYLEVLQEFGHERYCIDFKDVTQGALADRMDEVLGSRDMLRKRIAEALPRVLEASRRQFDYLLTVGL